jgi:hypothetical protein
MVPTLGHVRPGMSAPTLDTVLDLPRSVRLALWGTAVLTGGATVTAAVNAVSTDDEPHELEPDQASLSGVSGLPPDLAGLLEQLRSSGVTGLRAALPAAGDPLGLPGPAAFNTAAVEAGECVLTEPPAQGPWWGLVPRIMPFGSVWEPGTMVSWRVISTASRRVTDLISVAEAERALREAMRDATEELSRLDVARWREDAADRLAAVRSGALGAGVLPPSTPPRCVQVLATAARVRAIVALASEDDGAAVTGHEAVRRSRALRDLDTVCRRTMAAAANGILEPAR